MKTFKEIINDNPRVRQYINYSLVVLVLVIISVTIVHLKISFENKATSSPIQKIGASEKIKVSGLSNGAKKEHSWIEKEQKNILKIETELKSQRDETAKLSDQLKSINEKVLEQPAKPYSGGVDTLVAEMQNMLLDLDSVKAEMQTLREKDEQDFKIDPTLPKLESFDLNPKTKNSKLKVRSTENYIPAGAYVSAKVISGVDASVGTNSQSEPKPVLFRIIDKAQSSSRNGKIQETDIKGCLVTGAASGEISSEKVYVRLLKMTCTKEDGNIFETEVKGYMAGSGKVGQRGVVVKRNGDKIQKSILAGVIEGIAGGTKKTFESPLNSFNGLSTVQPGVGDVAGEMAASGIKNAADTAKQLLLEEARQYQPIIEMPSGIDVELVFHEGVELN